MFKMLLSARAGDPDPFEPKFVGIAGSVIWILNPYHILDELNVFVL